MVAKYEHILGFRKTSINLSHTLARAHSHPKSFNIGLLMEGKRARESRDFRSKTTNSLIECKHYFLATGWFVVVLKRMIFSVGPPCGYGDRGAYAEWTCAHILR